MDYTARFTTAGLAKIAAAAAANSHITLTQIAVGDGNGQYYDLAATPNMAALVHEVWRGAIDLVSIDAVDPNKVVIEAPLATGHGPFTLREGGVFDSDGTLILVWLMPLTTVPALAEGSDKDIRFRVSRVFSNAAVITLYNDGNVATASRNYVDAQGVAWKSSHLVAVNANYAMAAADRGCKIDAANNDVTVTFLAANNAAARRVLLTRRDASANHINLAVAAGTILRLTDLPDVLTMQDQVAEFLPIAEDNNWVQIR